MNTPFHHDTLQPGVPLGSTQTPSSRPAPSSRNLNTSKRVCFYKSGDPQFTGQWMVLNNRTFKTFDALLDALSKKVPLPFGVRTITTPKGRHTIWNLGDLQNGGSYVCSDKKKIKPLNLDEVNRRQVPWNTTRTTSAGRLGRRRLIQQLAGKTGEVKTAKMAENAKAVWTPKRLVVFKNRDPNTKSIVVLQRRTAPTFQALLDYLSQVMQFPVVKLYTPDGRRVEGLPALILCSGIVVAAGNEPFRPGNFKLKASLLTSQSASSESMLQAKTQPQQKAAKKSVKSKPRSKHFSLSSERYIVDQITESLNKCFLKDNEQKTGSLETMNNQLLESDEIEPCNSMSGTEQKDEFIMPTDDEIEKSFRVNQDGSMTVEMKVHLAIKQEELIQWTTTVSRTCVNSQQMAVCLPPVSGYNSPESNNSYSNQTAEAKKDNCKSQENSAAINQSIRLSVNGDNHSKIASSGALEKPKLCSRRPTPGPRCVRRKETSAENIKRPSQTEVQESTVGTYSYIECTTEGEVMEGYCVVSHSSSSSTTPVPKPRRNSSKTASTHKNGIAEVHLQNNGTGMTYSYENDFPQSASSGAQNASKNELLSLSSSQSSQSQKRHTDIKTQARSKSSDEGIENTVLSIKKQKTESTQKSTKSKKGVFAEPSATDKKQKNGIQDSLKDLRTSRLPESRSNTGSEKKTCRLAKSDKHDQNTVKNKKEQSEQKENSETIRDLSQNVDFLYIDTLIPHSRKENGTLPQLPQAPFKNLTKQKSLNDKIKSPKESRELSESISMPVIHSTSSDVHQYVKNWLENIQPESVPYMDEMDLHKTESEPRAKFQIGSDFSDTSKIKNTLENDSTVGKSASPEDTSFKRSVSCTHVMSKEETVETKKIRGFCKSMPSVKIEPAKQETCMRIHKSSEALVSKEQDLNGETLENTKMTTRSGMKQVMDQLCLSIQTIRRASSDSCLTSLENKKRSSLPDFSTQMSSIFSSSSKSLFSFLTVMKLKDGISNIGNEGSGSYSEALHLMQSIEKLTSIEDNEELKASLSSLHNSTTPHLKSSWNDFQEKNDTEECPPLSPKQSEQEFALDVNSEKDDQDKKQKDLKNELNMDENLHREITSLEGGDLTKDHFVIVCKTNIDCKNEDMAIKEDLAHTLEKEQSYSEKMENQDSGITNTDNAELYKLESSPQKNVLAVEDRTDITCIQGHVQTNQETRTDEETSQPNLCEEKRNLDNLMNQSPDYRQTDFDAKNLEQDNAACEHSDLNYDQANKEGQNTESLEKCDTNAGEEDVCHSPTSEVKHDLFGTTAEFDHNENYDVEQSNNVIFKKEENGHEQDIARSEASNCSVDNAVPNNIDNDLKEDGTTASIQDMEEDKDEIVNASERAFDKEPKYPVQSGQESEYTNQNESCNRHESDHELQILQENSVCRKQTRSFELNDEDVEDMDEQSKDFETQLQQVFTGDHSSKNSSVSSKCGNIETPKTQSEDTMGMEEAATDYTSQCEHLMEIPQQLLDFVNLALKTSALTFKCDSNGQPRIQPDRCRITEMSLSESSVDHHYTQKCLPSPNTSELSDYRPEATNSSADLSLVSTDLLTESGNDEADKQGNINKSTKSINRALDNGSMKPHLLADIKSLASSPDSISNYSVLQPAHYNSDFINENPKTVQCLPVNAELDSGEGILIDKGRWLLKENHLIRKSPPVPTGMYEDADTTSADTGQENTDDDYTFKSSMIQHPTLAVISSSELEDMAKPITPKCTYFNMVHNSDYDPFLDNQSIDSNNRKGVVRKSKELKVSPMGETSKMCAKQTGSLPSFASVEFKLAAGKVYPEGGPASSVVEKSARHHSENESVEGLNLTCGQHCPIL
ncbi:oxygen-regulated protein 1 [Trichomycterus rosablanca]|uniref:oxygen-regulated protein 1 n=1 Tax=Trichomycterus rosablanca TaxID=2290929 RepID=UPI002F35E90B